jgi:hypothetical protein
MDQFIVCNNWTLFIGGFTNFTMVKMFRFIQNLMKLKVNWDAFWCSVATLAFGSWPKQGHVRLWAKRGSLGVKVSVKEWTLTLPKEFPPWELESRWTPKCSESDCRCQNPMHWGVFYTIENLLKRRCLKWVHMTHLDIWNTSYGQKKGQESNWQFDSRPLKVENRPISLRSREFAPTPYSSIVFSLDSHFSPLTSLGTCHVMFLFF